MLIIMKSLNTSNFKEKQGIHENVELKLCDLLEFSQIH